MRPSKLSRPMLVMLHNACKGLPLTDGLTGRSEHGGSTWTRLALMKRGLLNLDSSPTSAGRAASGIALPKNT